MILKTMGWMGYVCAVEEEEEEEEKKKLKKKIKKEEGNKIKQKRHKYIFEKN